MSLRTLSQNKFSLKRFNSTNSVYAQYWGVSFSSSIGGPSGNSQKHIAKDKNSGATYVVLNTKIGRAHV